MTQPIVALRGAPPAGTPLESYVGQPGGWTVGSLTLPKSSLVKLIESGTLTVRGSVYPSDTINGGSADSFYLSRRLDGGDAATVYGGVTIDGGTA